MDNFNSDIIFGIFPEWSYSVDSQHFTLIEKSTFQEKFIITKYQLMGCEIEQSQKDTFFRVVIEYLFTENVNEVHVTDTIDKIYKFKLPGSSTGTSFGVVETFDFNLQTPTDAFRFAGTATIDTSFTLWSDTELNMTKVPVEKGQSKQGKTSRVICCFGRSETAP
ncbi:uncharacterized protein LOC120353099 [Nilaparvata lugens]|uniref:uncharacterized protein LOC120353099 n=1 Tax=Nilaparvata lugens TaxID=108931 RepID=UPI00193E5ECA|nr:uncharacterized protein LOC120353099 [Nilaparvata lugens]